jgi:hypothetical protein
VSLPRLDREQLAAALAAAGRMRERDIDPHHLAAALLYLNARCTALEALYKASDRYLRFGLPEHELSEMRLLVGRLRERDAAAEDPDDDEVEHTLPL